MTTRENIQIFHQVDVDTYLDVLKTEHGAEDHPTQPGYCLVDDLPFYKPKQVEEHVSVLGFNLVPLPGVLLDALANHSELVPDDALIVWTIEQELLLETTMGNIRNSSEFTPSKP